MPSSSPWTKRYLELLQPLQRSLETYCRRALRNSSLVEDVLQSVVEKTFADFDRFAEGTNFRAWIFRYLHFEVLSCNRREFGEVGLRDDDQPSQSVNWEQVAAEQSFDRLLSDSEGILDQCDDAIAVAFRGLPEAERSVMLLRAIGEFKYAEIAEILNIPIGTVMSHLSRSRATLRHRLLEFARERGIPRRKPGHDE